MPTTQQHQEGQRRAERARSAEHVRAARAQLGCLRIHQTRRCEGCAGEALGARQQDDDEHREDRHRGEDAADQEVGGLLKQSEQEAGDDGAAVVAHAAERDRDETVEGQHRRIGEEGQQHLAAGKARKRADHAGERKARHAQVAFRQAERARGISCPRRSPERRGRSACGDRAARGRRSRPRRRASAARTADRSRRAAMSKSRGNGCGSVLHSIAVNCWTISASASVEST